MTLRSLLPLVFLTILFVQCAKVEVREVPLRSSEKELLEFSFKSDVNARYVARTITASVNENEISVSIPEMINIKSLIATFSFKGVAVLVNNVKQESGVTPNDFSTPLTYVVRAADGTEKAYEVKVTLLPEISPGLPHIYITTDGGASIVSKKDYVQADIRIEGGDHYEDYEGRTSIRGRGNSTWYNYPKKPYRLKLDEKASLLGLSAEKDWILLANYLDESLMCNAVAMKIGRLLEMPFTHHMIPVDVTLNGVFIGNYMFSEHKEVEDNRINVGKDGVLLEMDVYFDEDYKFTSNRYKLPVMIQYPDLGKMSTSDADVEFNKIKSDFHLFEEEVFSSSFPNTNYLDYFDAEAFVNYMIVYELSMNGEINHPKSTYLYKKANEKYKMGPIWDFDWGFGYPFNNRHFDVANVPLFWNDGSKGSVFFGRLMSDPSIRTLFKQKWNAFKAEKFAQLIKYTEDYAEAIRESLANDHAVWKQSWGSGDIDRELGRMIGWLNARVNYIDNQVASW